MGKKSILIVVLSFAAIAVIAISSNIITIDNNYKRNIYSVIVFNNTKSVVEDLAVTVGTDETKPETITTVADIESIAPNEYKKINIDTSNPSPEWKSPYNVFVKLIGNNTSETAGYFGIDTGGMALLYINESDNGAALQRIFEHDNKYKKVYRKHLKNQNLKSWYN